MTDPEPLPAEDPLWDAPNLVITPHVAGNTTNYVARAMDLLMANLDRKMKGEKLVSVVDRESGY